MARDWEALYRKHEARKTTSSGAVVPKYVKGSLTSNYDDKKTETPKRKEQEKEKAEKKKPLDKKTTKKRKSNNRTLALEKEKTEYDNRPEVGVYEYGGQDWNDDGRTESKTFSAIPIRGGAIKRVGTYDEKSEYTDPRTGQRVKSPIERDDVKLRGQEFMTATERATFNSLFQTSPLKAKDYYTSLYATLEARRGSSKNFLERNVVSGAVKYGTYGMMSTIDLMNNLAGGETSKEFEALMAGESAYREGASAKNEEGGKGMKLAGDVVQGFAQFIPQVVLSRINPVLGMSSIMVPASGSYSAEAKLQGASDSERLIYGVLGGGAEGLLQRVLFIDKVLASTVGKGAVNGVVMNGIVNMAKSRASMAREIGTQGLGEGLEEALIDPFTGLVSKFTFDEEQPWFGEGGVVDPASMAYNFLVGTIVGTGISAGAHMPMMENIKQIKAEIDENYPQALTLAYALPDTTVPVEATESTGEKGLKDKVKEKVWGKKEVDGVTEEPKYKSRVLAEAYRNERKQVSLKEVVEFMQMVDADYKTYAEVMSQKYSTKIPEHQEAVKWLDTVDKQMAQTIEIIREETTKEEGLKILKGYTQRLGDLSKIEGLTENRKNKILKAVGIIDTIMEEFGPKQEEVETEPAEAPTEAPAEMGPTQEAKVKIQERILVDGYQPTKEESDIGLVQSRINTYKDMKANGVLEFIESEMAKGTEQGKIRDMLTKRKTVGGKMDARRASSYLGVYNTITNGIDELASIEAKVDAQLNENKEAKKKVPPKEEIQEKLKGKQAIGSIGKDVKKMMAEVPVATIEYYDVMGKKMKKGVNTEGEKHKAIIELIQKVPLLNGVTFEFHDNIEYNLVTEKEAVKRGYIEDANAIEQAEGEGNSGKTQGRLYRILGNRGKSGDRPVIQIFKGANNDTILEEIIHQFQYNFAQINPEFAEAVQIWNQNYIASLLDNGYDEKKINANTLLEGFADAVITSHMGWAKNDMEHFVAYGVDSSAVVSIKDMMGKELFEALLGDTLMAESTKVVEVPFDRLIDNAVKAKTLKVKERIEKDKGRGSNFNMVLVDVNVRKNLNVMGKYQLYVHAPDGVTRFEDSLEYKAFTSLDEAKAFLTDPARIKDYHDKVTSITQRREQMLSSYTQVVTHKTSSKTGGLTEIKLSKGCGRTSFMAELVLSGRLPRLTEFLSCYGGTCFVNFKLNAIRNYGWEDVNIQEMKFANVEMFDKWFANPKFLERLNQGRFFRHGVAGCDSNTIATGIAYEWLKRCKEHGIKSTNVMISAGYAPVTDAQYQQLAEFNDILNLQFTVSPWFERNEIMLRLAEFDRARANGLNPTIRIVTNADNVTGIDMMSRYHFTKAMMNDLGIDQGHILETPYHDDRPAKDRPEEYKNQKYKLRSKPTGDFLNICCETGQCQSCAFQCINNMNPNLSLVDYYDKPDTSEYEDMKNALGKGMYGSAELYHMRPANRTWEQLAPDVATFFKASKVLDENGNLQVVYHGTFYSTTYKNGEYVPAKDEDFRVFKKNSHFGSQIHANSFADVIGNHAINRVYPVYLNITNPMWALDTGGNWAEKIKTAKSKGFDGISYLNRWEGVYLKGEKDEDGLGNGKELYMSDIQQLIRGKYPDDKFKDAFTLSDEEFLELFDADYSYIAFQPNQVKSIFNEHPTTDPDILYKMIPADPFAPAFYSRMEKDIQEKLPAMIEPESLRAFVMANARAEEIKWSGILSFIDDKDNRVLDGKIRKEWLMEWLGFNKLEVEFEERSDDARQKYEDESAKAHFFAMDKMEDIIETYPEVNIHALMESVRKVIQDAELDGVTISDTEAYVNVWYESSENNPEAQKIPREDLVELYRRVEAHQKIRTDGGNMKPTNDWFKRDFTVSRNQSVGYREILFKFPNLSEPYVKDLHWGSTKNVVIHLRATTKFSGKKIDGKAERILFLEEVQSDLHEDALEVGYKDEERLKAVEKLVRTSTENYTAEDFSEIFNETEDGRIGYRILDANGDSQGIVMALNEAEAIEGYVRTRVASMMESGGVPDAPFRKTWHEFALKKALRIAVEEGYDRIAWTTGEQNADFYHLRGMAESMRVDRGVKKEGNLEVTLYDENGDSINGWNRKEISRQAFEEKFPEDTVKLVLEELEFRGPVTAELQYPVEAGGEGMKNFYDIGGKSSQNIASYLNRYVKQWGSSVEMYEIPIPERDTGSLEYSPQPSIGITDAMRQSILYEGQALYHMAPTQSRTYDSIQAFMKAMEDQKIDPTVYAYAMLPSVGDRFMVEEGVYASDEDAMKTADELAMNLVREDVAGGVFDYDYYGMPVKTIGSQITYDMMTKGYVSLLDAEVKTPKDLALLAQVYRDPRYETFRAFYLKNGQIIGHQGLTGRLPSMVLLHPHDGSPMTNAESQQKVDEYIAEIKRRATKLGADGVYLMHNHPSGDPTPSRDDMGVTSRYEKALGGLFMGHVIIDTDSYSITDKSGNVTVSPLNLGKDMIHSPSIKHPLGGAFLTDPHDFADLGKRMTSTVGYTPFIFCTIKGQVRVVQELPNQMVSEVDTMKDYIEEKMVEFGAPVVFAIVRPNNRRAMLSCYQLVQTSHLLDAIIKGEDKGFRVISGAKRVIPPQGVNEYVSNRVNEDFKGVDDPTNFSMKPVTSKTRSFAYTFGEGELSDKARDRLETDIKGGTYEYDIYKNKDLMADAREYILQHSKVLPNGTRDYSELEAFILDERTALTNMMVAVAFQLQETYLDKRMFFMQTGINKAMRLNEAIASKATVAGQAIQALSLWARLSPEGIVQYATKVLTESLSESEQREVFQWAYSMERDFKRAEAEAIQTLAREDGIEALVEEVRSEYDPVAEEANAIARILSTSVKGDSISMMQDTIVDFAKARFPKKSFNEPWQYVVDAIKNRKEYKDAWRMVQHDLWDNLDPDQRNDLIISKFYNYHPTSFVSESKLKKSIGNELKEMETTIKQIVLDSLVNQEQYQETLVQNLMDKAGLTSVEAQMLENKLRKKYTAMTEAKKRAIAEQMFKVKPEREAPEGRAIQRLIEMSNIGVLTKKDYELAVANMLGLTDADAEFMQYLHDQAQMMQGLEGQERIEMQAMIMDDIASKQKVSIGQKLSLIQTMAQLLNPVTFLRNFYGNSSFAMVEYVAENLNVPLDMMASALGKSKIAQTAFGQKMGFDGHRTTPAMPIKRAVTMWHQFGVGLRESNREISMGINTQIVKENKFDIPQQRVWHTGVMSEVEKLLARELRSFDRASYMSSFVASLEEQMLVYGVLEPTAQMVKDAHQIGLYRTFQDDNLVSGMFVGAKRLANVIGISPKSKSRPILGSKWFGLGDLILKYPKTPANLLARSLDYSPIGAVSTVGRLMMEPDMSPYLRQKMLTMGLTRSVIGTAIWGLGAMLFSAGVITGSPDDEEEQGIKLLRKAMQISTYQWNWSALFRWMESGGPFGGQKQEFQEGDNVDSYSWLLPMGLGIAIGANIQRALDRGEDPSNMDVLITALKESTGVMLEQPMMTGINDLFGVGKYGEDADVRAGFISAILEAPASFYPTILSRGKQMFDEKARNIYNNNSDIQTAINRVVSKTPLAGGLETPIGDIQAVEPYVTPFGEQARYWDKSKKSWARRVFDAFANPAYSAKIESTPLIEWTMNLYDIVPERGGELAPTTKNNWTYEFTTSDGEELNIALTQEEVRILAEYRGKRLADEYTRIMNQYQNVSDVDTANQVIERLTKIKSDVGRELRGEVIRMRGLTDVK